MTKRLIAGAVAVAVMSFAAAAAVQVSATVTLKSGEKVTGQLDDLSAAGLSVLIGGGFRHFPVGDLALIDFGGGSPLNQAEVEKLWSPGTHLFLLKNGTVINGELFDIGGRSPLRVTVKVGGTDRDLSSNDLSQIYLARPSTIESRPGSAPAQPGLAGGREVQASARQWTATGITVRQGQTVQFESGGEIKLNKEGYMVARPAGSTENTFDKKAPLPNVPVGALIGRIGQSRLLARPFAIGDRTSLNMPASGELFLGVNDSNLTDNSGSFTVRIKADAPAGANR